MGSKGGGWRGGAGDQVIRIINLDSSCLGGGGSEDFSWRRMNPGEEAVASDCDRAATRTLPGNPKLRKPRLSTRSSARTPPPSPPSPPPLSPGRSLRASRAVPAASFRARDTRDLESARPEPRRALSAPRAALAAAGGKAHASREAQGPRAAAAARLGKS